MSDRCILIVSDIHGEEEGVLLVKKAIERFWPEMVLSAGDQCPYQGENLFRSLTAVRGNCDRFYEYHDLPFPPPLLKMTVLGRKICMTHGDAIWYDELELEEGTIFISGHTHVPSLRKENGIYLVNPGSASRPRSSEGASAALLSEDGLELFSLMDFEMISALSFSERKNS